MRVVDVRIDQDDALPRAERRHTSEHRNDERRRDERWQNVVAAVTGTAVPMSVVLGAGQDPLDGVGQVGFGAAAGLEDGDAGRRVRHEHVTEPVTSAPAELQQHLGDVGDQVGTAVDVEQVRVHGVILPTVVARRGVHNGGRLCMKRWMTSGQPGVAWGHLTNSVDRQRKLEKDVSRHLRGSVEPARNLSRHQRWGPA
jgi:hypothetical protein